MGGYLKETNSPPIRSTVYRKEDHFTNVNRASQKHFMKTCRFWKMKTGKTEN